MTPESPVVAGLEQFEIIYGQNQPEVQPLPVLIGRMQEPVVISRWRMSDTERKMIADGNDVYLVQTVSESLQVYPVYLAVGGVNQPPGPFLDTFSVGHDISHAELKKCLDGLLEES